MLSTKCAAPTTPQPHPFRPWTSEKQRRVEIAALWHSCARFCLAGGLDRPPVTGGGGRDWKSCGASDAAGCGCKAKKQSKFFKRFFSTIETDMIMVTGDQSSDSDVMSNREKIVRWKFAQLDTNKNNRLERKEWKAYRQEMKQWNKVRRCGRNFMRFCDVDGNKKITLPEWLQCTIEADTPPSPVIPSPDLPPRNPFLDILKSE
uniref:EF-hand domain-containing protein n=1 Tax=Plectus sambesii TaxID=2011161 RepID=A0A914VKN9_9BILA